MSETSASAAPVTVKAFGLTDVGRVRKNNEDAFLVADLARLGQGGATAEVTTLEATEHAVLLAVSDGMGGANAGEVASALVVDALREAMMSAKGNWDEATTLAVEEVNRKVWEAAREPGRKGMGATLTAVCVHADQAHIAEVGDSRAYLVRNGRIRQVTRDQSFVQLLVDSGALKPEEADKYPMKNVVLQAMGQKEDVKVALGRLGLRRGDRLLLCSDGLSNKVTSAEMLRAVEGTLDLDVAARELVALANERGGEDNITVVLADLDGEGLALPKAQETLTQTFQVLAEYKAAGEDLEDDGASGQVNYDDMDDLDDAPPAPRAVVVAKGEAAKSEAAKSEPAKAAPPAQGAESALGGLPAIAILVLVGLAAVAAYFVVMR